MRKIAVLLLAAAGVSLAGAASAADLGTAPIYRKAPPVEVFTWTGSYVGLYIGGASGNTVRTTDSFLGATTSYDLGSSVIGGYTGGYNLQLSPSWLIGYESETGYMKLKGSALYPGTALNAATETGSLYSVWAARLGYVMDKSLLYVKGGAVLTRFDSSSRNGTVSDHEFEFGYAVGGGWEYAFAPKWSVKAEYLYLGFDKDLSFGPPGLVATSHFGGVHTGKVGVNYKFDWFSLLR